MTEPAKIGKYEVLDVLGRGAFGVVYRCLDRGLDRIVAVKVLLAAEHASQELLDRFAREAKAAAKLSHPHVVQVFDAGLESGKPYLVMEYVEGQTLDSLADDLGKELMPVLLLVYHLADALAYSHERGIIHRDIKPSNIIVDARGRPKLMDFGLARLADEARWLSSTGDLIGTPRYMSPEQALLPSDEVDARTDIYSLGAIFYELLSRRPLVDGPTPLAALKQLTDSQPVPISQWRPDLPSQCAEVVDRMIAPDRNRRFASATAAAEAIKALILECAIATPEIRSLALPSVASPRPRADEELAPRGPQGMAPAQPGYARTLRHWQNGWRMAALSLVVAGAGGIGWTLWRPLPKETESRPHEKGVDGDSADLSAALEGWNRRFESLASTRDDRQYQTQLNELREELNLAIRRRPNHRELRALRGKILARNGDFRAAMDDWESAQLDRQEPSIARMHLNAFAMWELLILGSISESAFGQVNSTRLKSRIEACQAIDADAAETARVGAMAHWIGIAVGEHDFDPDLEPSMPVLSKEDPAFSDAQTWRALVFLQHANSIHYRQDSLPEGDRTRIHEERDLWDQRAVQALREGLEVDVHHLGLLFLRTYRWSRRLEWDTNDGTAWADAEKRYKPAFETAFHRYRVTPARLGFESAMGRAILLNEVGEHARALDQVSEFVDRGHAPPEITAFWVWLQFNQPPNDLIDATLASTLLKSTDSLAEGSVPTFGIYLMRGLCQATLGRIDDARRELLHGKSVCKIDNWEAVSGSFSEWLEALDQSTTHFRDRTIETLGRFAIPETVRMQLQQELLLDLTQRPERIASDLSTEEQRDLLATGNFRMAKMAAERDDREGVLHFTRASLELRSPACTEIHFEQDEILQAWTNDSTYRVLLDEYREEDR